MLNEVYLAVFLLSSSVFGLPVEDNGFVGSGIEYSHNSLRFPMDMGMGMTEENRIYGGQEAAVGQFPHHVSLRIFLGHNCGGSILNERFILTAAHCVNGSLPHRAQVEVGAHRANSRNGTLYNVTHFIIHEDFELNLTETIQIVRNDIALIRTATPIQFTDLVRPIPLHPGFIQTAQAVTIGWGQTNNGNRNLKYLNMTTITNDECRRLVIEKFPPPIPPPPIHGNLTICAFSGLAEHGVCFGDSGGPLISDNQIIGLSSWVYPCAKGVPDGFTRVSNYIDWIYSNMQKFEDI